MRINICVNMYLNESKKQKLNYKFDNLKRNILYKILYISLLPKHFSLNKLSLRNFTIDKKTNKKVMYFFLYKSLNIKIKK